MACDASLAGPATPRHASLLLAVLSTALRAQGIVHLGCDRTSQDVRIILACPTPGGTPLSSEFEGIERGHGRGRRRGQDPATME